MIPPHVKKAITKLVNQIDFSGSQSSPQAQAEDLADDVKYFLIGRARIAISERQRYVQRVPERSKELDAEFQRAMLIPYARLSKLIARLRWHTWGNTLPLHRFPLTDLFLAESYDLNDLELRQKLKELEARSSPPGLVLDTPSEFRIAFHLHGQLPDAQLNNAQKVALIGLRAMQEGQEYSVSKFEAVTQS